MRAKSVKNITRGRVRIELVGGVSVNLPSGSTVENVNIINEEEIKGKVFIIKDLTEVNENNKSKTQLRD